jgi:hypothetical protein
VGNAGNCGNYPRFGVDRLFVKLEVGCGMN